MNAFYEHHKDSIRFGYRCFDRSVRSQASRLRPPRFHFCQPLWWARAGLEPVKLLYSETAVVIGLVNIFVPFMVLPIMASIERISPSLEEAAQNLGASWYRMFGRVILPLSLPGLISGCLLVYSLSISAFVTPALMGNPRERLVGQQIYDEVLVSFNWPGAASLSLTLVLVTAALMFGALFATRRAGRREKAS